MFLVTQDYLRFQIIKCIDCAFPLGQEIQSQGLRKQSLTSVCTGKPLTCAGAFQKNTWASWLSSRTLSRLPLAYLVSQGFWKWENEFKVACNGHEDKTTHVRDGEREKSPGNTGLPGEKVGGHSYWSFTHLTHPGKKFVTSGKTLHVESLYQPKY